VFRSPGTISGLVVGHPPTLSPLDQLGHALCVGDLVGRTPEVVLGHVAVQVLDRDVMVGPGDRPLYDSTGLVVKPSRTYSPAEWLTRSCLEKNDPARL